MEKYNTIELLECPLTVSDAWAEINNDYNIKNYFLNCVDGIEYVVRLIGPSVSSERLYVPSGVKGIVSEKSLSGIMKCNMEAFIEGMNAVKVLSSVKLTQEFIDSCLKNFSSAKTAISCMNIGKANSRDPYKQRNPYNLDESFKEAAIFLSKLYYRTGWQKVIMSNVITRTSSALNSYNSLNETPFVRILTLSNQAFTNLLLSIGAHASKSKVNPNKVKISGIFAHDITLRKAGHGLATNYSFSLSPNPEHLSATELKTLLLHGMVDIKSILKDVNNRSEISYLYRSTSNYRLGGKIIEEINKEIKNELNSQPDLGYNQHYEEMDNKVNELPLEAFENRVDHNNPINALEV